MKLSGFSQITSSCYCSALLSLFLFHPRHTLSHYFAGILSPEVKINVYFMSLEGGTKSSFCRLISICIFHCCCFSCFNRQRAPANIANVLCSFNAKLKLVCPAVHRKAQQAAKFECYVWSNEKSRKPFHLMVCVKEGVKEPVQKQGVLRRTWQMPTLE